MYTIYTDGGARGNPGPAGAGAVIYDAKGTERARVSEYLGHRTNNWAEYEALRLALEALLTLIPEDKRAEAEVVVKLDSQLIERQLKGAYRVKEPALKEQYKKVDALRANFPRIDFLHIPREENTRADALANEAMDRGR